MNTTLSLRSAVHPVMLLLVLSLAPDSAAQGSQCNASLPQDRPRVGLVLGGGGARGGAHVGVLKYLEKNRIPVDLIAGTSMGSIIGGLYASGLGSQDIEKTLIETDWANIFTDATDRSDWTLRRKSDDALGLYGPKFGLGKNSSLLPGGAVAGQKVGLMLEGLVSQHVQAQHFDDLPIPFRAVAADLVTGDMVVLEDGPLALAMRASMSVPGAFDPVPQDRALLVDGGIVRNLPVDVARGMGADVVIAVNVEYPKAKAEELQDLLSVVNQLTTLMVAGNTERQIESLGPGDVLIKPRLGTDFSSADFDRIAETIPVGFEASEWMGEKLEALALDEQRYRAWRQRVESCQSGPPVVHFVRLENHSRFADEVIEQMISVAPGEPLDHQELERDIGYIYALGFIRHARYSVIEENGQQGILLEVEQDVRGTQFIETGLGISGDSRGTSLDLKLAYLKTDLNDRGAEFRGAIQLGKDPGVSSEIYLPLDSRSRWILQPQLRASRRDVLVFDNNGDPLGELELQEVAGEIAFGREFGRHAGLFVSMTRYGGDFKVKIGDPSVDNYRFNGGDWSVSAIYDRLDNRYMPSSGSLVQLQYIDSSQALGADDEFEQLLFSLFAARTWGSHTAWFGSKFNSTLDDNAPIYGLLTGGGFLNMSGFERDELVNQHFGFSLLGYRYRIGQSGLMPAYLGTTLEYGGAAATASSVYGNGILNGSVYLAYDSPVGPLYLGYGWSEENSGLVFLRLGTILGEQAIGRR
jgi:NTE family protein